MRSINRLPRFPCTRRRIQPQGRDVIQSDVLRHQFRDRGAIFARGVCRKLSEIIFSAGATATATKCFETSMRIIPLPIALRPSGSREMQFSAWKMTMQSNIYRQQLARQCEQISIRADVAEKKVWPPLIEQNSMRDAKCWHFYFFFFFITPHVTGISRTCQLAGWNFSYVRNMDMRGGKKLIPSAVLLIMLHGSHFKCILRQLWHTEFNFRGHDPLWFHEWELKALTQSR